jgi:hypothetical protein
VKEAEHNPILVLLASIVIFAVLVFAAYKWFMHTNVSDYQACLNDGVLSQHYCSQFHGHP